MTKDVQTSKADTDALLQMPLKDAKAVFTELYAQRPLDRSSRNGLKAFGLFRIRRAWNSTTSGSC